MTIQPRYGAFQASAEPMSPKDPVAVVDYTFDFDATGANGEAPYLEPTETISTAVPDLQQVFPENTTSTLNIDASAVVSSPTTGRAATAVQVWLSGGAAGEIHELGVDFITSGSRTDRRSMQLDILER